MMIHAALVLLLVGVAAQVRAQEQPQLQWAVAEAQPLVDASVRFGLRNADVTFTIPALTILSLANSSFARANDSQAVGGKAYADGTLTIQGAVPINTSSADAFSSSVLDAGMRVGLVPPLLTAADVQLRDVGIINQCWGSISLLGTTINTPIFMALLSLTPAKVSVRLDRAILYLPRSTQAFDMYNNLWLQSPPRWTAVWAAYSQQAAAIGWTGIATTSFTTAHEAEFHAVVAPFLAGNFIVRILDHPKDPLLRYMRANGLLTPPRWCNNGTLVPEAIANAVIDPVWGPVWMADTQDQAAAYLVNATALAPVQQAARLPIAAVALFLPAVSLHEAAVPGRRLQLSAPLLLWGPHNEDPTSLIPVLDLSSRTSPLFTVTTPSGQLYLQRLALTLAAWPTTVSSTATALSLAALAAAGVNGSAAAAARTGALVELHNVTLVVPVLDFLALLTLATDNSSSSVRACVDPATLQHAARLAPSITGLSASAASWDVLSLSAYTAWSVNGSALLVRPQTPVPAKVTQRCTHPPPAPAASGSSSDGSTSAQTVGLVVGCTVGGAALLLAVAGAVLRRRHKDRAYTLPAQNLSAHLEGGKPVGADATTSDPAAHFPHPTPSHCVATAANDATSPLLALLQSQERSLLRQGQPGPAAGSAEDGGCAGHGAATTLGQAHEQLVRSVVESRQQGAAASNASRHSDPRQAVQQLATRLQGDEADAVTLTRVLGRGGGGTVYQGVWRGLPVAVKTMVFEAWEGDEGVAGGDHARVRYVRAIMETALSASLGHLHVVATYHYDIKRMDDTAASASDGLQVTMADQALDQAQPWSSPATPSVKTFKVFLVQELCSCSLRTALDQGTLAHEPQSTYLVLLHQVACGLEYLHGQGVIHGDLTPGNVLLKASASSVLVKLADFGLSNRLDGQATHVSGFGAGTPFYVAPEVVLQRRSSTASDIFSLGVIAWEVLSRQSPDVPDATGAFKPNPLFPKFPPGLKPPAEVQALITRCLSSHPHKRPRASEVQAVLDRHIILLKNA